MLNNAMYNIPINEPFIAKNGLEVNFEISPDNGDNLNKYNTWTYHSINAFAILDGLKTHIGFLNIAYVDDTKGYAESILLYACRVKSDNLKHHTDKLHVKDITEHELDNIFETYQFNLSLEFHAKNNKIEKECVTYDEKRTIVQKYLDKMYSNDYDNFIEHHYNKPEPDMIRVNDDFKRLGIGTQLYQRMAIFCGLNGLKLYQSSLLSEDSKALWEVLKKKDSKIDYYSYRFKGKEGFQLTNRYFLNYTHLALELKQNETLTHKTTKILKNH